MEEQLNSLYIKRSQKNYSINFKLSLMREVETTNIIGICAIARKYGIQSKTTVKRWLEKYSNSDRDNRIEP